MTDYEKFSSLFRYDEETGELFWKIKGRGRQLDRPAGSYNDQGYRIIHVDYCNHRVSRIVWLLNTGLWPINEIDHKDRNRRNNRFKNLRDVTRSINMLNCSVHIDCKSGVKGVSQRRSGNWVARCRGKTIGTYPTKDEAFIAYSDYLRSIVV